MSLTQLDWLPNKDNIKDEKFKLTLCTDTDYKPIKCDVCLREFSENVNLETSIETCTDFKPGKCTECGKELNFENDILKVDIKTHTVNKPIKCDACLRGFSDNVNLETSIETCTDFKPGQCTECGKELNIENTTLKVDIKTHTVDKPYTCDVCGKWFSHISSLKRHIRTHTGDLPGLPFKCDVCDKRFRYPSNLQSHLITQTVDQPYLCHICGKQFGRKICLIEHIRTHTFNTFKCDGVEKDLVTLLTWRDTSENIKISLLNVMCVVNTIRREIAYTNILELMQ